MGSSIRRQFALIFIGLMAGTILLCLLLNYLFLEKYYRRSKMDVLYDAYAKIRQAANSDSYGSAEFVKELDDVCSMYNIIICIMDANSQTKYVSVNGGQELEVRLMDYIFGFSVDELQIMEEGEDYRIQMSGVEGDRYLEMYGRLNSGISFIMRTPMESIRESAKIANRFFAYIGCLGAVGGGLIIWYVSRKITGPILELNHISQRMVHLDFEAKYRPDKGRVRHPHNEIDLLGQNINKLSDSLEHSLSELKTANNELKKDLERNLQIDEMRREFLSNVTHELKTPIALIQGYAEGLQEGVNDDPADRDFYCEVIMDEARKMNGLVQRLLTLNQLESGNEVVSLERVDLAALIRNYLQSAEILAKQNDIDVRMEDYPATYVWADEFSVEEVFANYFSNAVNHCTGEKIIDVKLGAENGKVRVDVFNTGEPIPEEALGHIWEKFYKVDKARTRAYGGSGVGLSIVKAVMESMNQGYGVENYDNGVLFWFELDAVQDQESV